jgi:enoyl-CoA hydratase
MSEDVLLIERPAPGLVIATLNRPKSLNALSVALREALTQLFRGLEKDGDARVVILTGAGDRAFSAGLDLPELSQDTSMLDFAKTDDPVSAMRDYSGVVIGAINGVAITGGFELALACDILIASETARFADTHSRVGLLPGWGLSQILPRTIGAFRAKQLSLTGDFIGADKAAAWGIVSAILPAADLMTEARRIADAILAADAATIRNLKMMIDHGLDSTLAEGTEFEKSHSNAWNVRVGAEAIARATAAILQRGKS